MQYAPSFDGGEGLCSTMRVVASFRIASSRFAQAVWTKRNQTRRFRFALGERALRFAGESNCGNVGIRAVSTKELAAHGGGVGSHGGKTRSAWGSNGSQSAPTYMVMGEGLAAHGANWLCAMAPEAASPRPSSAASSRVVKRRLPPRDRQVLPHGAVKCCRPQGPSSAAVSLRRCLLRIMTSDFGFSDVSALLFWRRVAFSRGFK